MKFFVILLMVVSSALAQTNGQQTIFCKNTEKSCPIGLPGPDGSPPPVICIPAQIPSSKPGNGLCDNPCPDSCLPPNDMQCFQGEDSMGCKIPDMCFPSPSPNDECPRSCPINCQENEVQCQGKSWGNCAGPSYCMPKGNKIMIEYECPGFCPVECGPDQILCRQVDDKGCEQPGGCMPAMMPDKDGSLTCPNTCPISTACKPDEVFCSGPIDPRGCKGPDSCLPRMLGTDNRLCPGTCPNQMPCPDDSLTCNMVDANGCSMPTLCVPRTFPNPYPNPIGDGTCPNFCPVSCQPGFLQCPGPIDPNGCRVMDNCIPVQYGINNSLCPTTCPMFCPEGQFVCPPQTDDNGCMIQGGCVSDWSLCEKMAG